VCADHGRTEDPFPIGSIRLRRVTGSDDAGFDDKERIKAGLLSNPLVSDVMDVGVDADGHTNCPRIATTAAEWVAVGDADRAILFCGAVRDILDEVGALIADQPGSRRHA